MKPFVKVVIIDYGHGLPELSIKHYVFTDRNPNYTIYEWEINRRVAAYLINMLIDHGIEVYDAVANVWHTQHVKAWTALEQKNVSLEQRVLNANAVFKVRRGECLLLSLHHNLFSADGTARGPSEDRARGANYFVGTNAGIASKHVAATMAQIYRTHPHSKLISPRDICDDTWASWSNRPDLMLGAREWYMLTKSYMPAVCGEMGFYSSWKDVCVLTTPDGQSSEASVYFEGIKHYLIGAVNA